MRIAPERMRSRIEEGSGGLRIVIPSRGNWFAFLFLTAWLGGWVFGEVAAISSLLGVGPMRGSRGGGGPGAFLAFWLLGWTVGGAVALYAWIWILAGREIVRLDGQTLAISREPIGLPRNREFDWGQIRNLRVSLSRDPRSALLEPGTIAFDYGAKTYRFGNGLDEAEAAMLIDEVRQRFQPPA
jgi:hypothetical protein